MGYQHTTLTHLAPLALTCLLAACTPKGSALPAPAVAPPVAQIDLARLRNAEREPGQWLTGGGGWRGTHFSALNSFTPQNVGRLGFAWAFSTDTTRGLEATPIVVDGVMYTSGVAGRVYALDAASGKLRWSFSPPVDLQVARYTCCDQVNRGVAVWRGRIYVASLDGWLYALDAASGAVVWKADTFVDRHRAYSSTGAPIIAGDVVVIGNAGGEFDARGYVSAYDVQSGVFRWRFYTVPGDPSKPYEHPELAEAAKTWDPHSAWQYGGGGPVWDGMSYDPELDLLYIGTGNAETYPQSTRSPAGGDNLYTCSILAISPKTGRLAWYYQETPGDQWDFDADAPMVLVDRVVDGVPRKLLLHAPKNGIFYTLDRTNGKVVSAGKFVNVNWARGVDLKSGKVLVDREAADYRHKPKLIYPSSIGAHSWQPMAYSPDTGLVYVPTLDMGNIFYDTSAQMGYRPSQFNAGIGLVFTGFIELLRDQLPPEVKAELGHLLASHPDLTMRAYVQAWDPITQRQVWRTPDNPNFWDHAGVLATAGGLLVQGSDSGVLSVMDLSNGKVLKQIPTGSSIIAAPMMYQIDGVTYLAVMAGWGGGGWAVSHPQGAAYRYGNVGRILVFRLDGGAVPIPPELPPTAPFPQPPKQNADAASIERGAKLFGSNCAICHPNQPRSGSPDLRRMSEATHAAFDGIVLGGLRRAQGMPGWGDVLGAKDSAAIHAFLIDLAQQAWAGEQAGKKAGAGAAANDAGVIKGY